MSLRCSKLIIFSCVILCLVSIGLLLIFWTKTHHSQNYPSNCTNLTKFIVDNLAAHNNYRKLHNSPPLELNKKLSNFAQEWTNKIANDSQVKYRPNNKYGENIFLFPSDKVNGSDVVKSWYDEIKDYNFNTSVYSNITDHFTQVVWKNSAKLGVGCAKSSTGVLYVVANYDPKGNVIGEFAKNVLKKIN